MILLFIYIIFQKNTTFSEITADCIEKTVTVTLLSGIKLHVIVSKLFSEADTHHHK